MTEFIINRQNLRLMITGKKTNNLAGFFLGLFMIISFLCLGCATPVRHRPSREIEEKGSPWFTVWEILDFENKSQNGIIPPWVILFLDGGSQAIEELAEYENYYVFVSIHSGTNLTALEQWRAGFSADLDFARLAAVRIEKRFENATINYPDYEFGGYFEALIRSASDAVWHGASRDDDFWLLRDLLDKSGDNDPNTEIFDFLILVKIEKEQLEPQIRTLMRNVRSLSPMTRDQTAAVNRVQDRFFEGF